MSHTRFRVNADFVATWKLRSSPSRNRGDIWSVSNCKRNRFHNNFVCKQTLNHLAPLETRKIYLPFFCKSWTTTKIGRLEISKKLWLNPNMELNKRKWYCPVLSRVDFWIIWRCYSILCFHFCSMFRNNGIREQLDEND